jgi:deazaflavin-dependent oxidoreductase (nitroreductase family)
MVCFIEAASREISVVGADASLSTGSPGADASMAGRRARAYEASMATGEAKPRLGRRVARFNRLVTNRLMRPLARWLPGFGVVVHTGRHSRRQYRTPVNLFRASDGYFIALTYGKESDWVKNVQAANGCELITRGRRCEMTSPELIHDERRSLVARFVRPILRLIRVADFLHLKVAEEPRG